MNNIDPELRQRIDNYYLVEGQHNWEQTYHLRSPSYRRNVPCATYKMGMEKGMDGWELQEYKVKSYRIENNRAEVDIYFKEYKPSIGIQIVTQTTIWEKIDGVWYGRDVGSRIHLPFNEKTEVN
jgi:hypothetical protein